MARDLKLPGSSEFAWVWVVDFPAFEFDEEEKRFAATHHPFTIPLDRDLAKLDSRDQATVESIKSKAYDIVCNGEGRGVGPASEPMGVSGRRARADGPFDPADGPRGP